MAGEAFGVPVPRHHLSGLQWTTLRHIHLASESSTQILESEVLRVLTCRRWWQSNGMSRIQNVNQATFFKKKKEDTHSSKNVFWSLGGTGFFSVPKIHCLAGWAYCFQESAVRVFQLREQMPSNCSDLGIWGQERRSHHLNRWLDAASHCNPLPLLPFSRVALEEGCQRGDYRVTQLIFTAGKGKYLPTSLSLALPESAQSIEAKC